MTVQSTTHLPDGTEAPDEEPPATGPLAHPCPRCNATPGNPCTTRTGNPFTETFHKARITGNPQDSRPHRPLTLTPDLTDTICGHIRNGTTLTTAAQAVGLGPATLHRWILLADSDAEEHQLFREFREAVMRARAEGQAELAAKIIEAGNRKVRSIEPVIDPVKGGQAKDDSGEPLFKITYESDWKAHAFVLERSYPAEWGKRQTLEIDHRDPAEQVLATTGMQAAVDVAARRFADALRERREQRALEAAARAEQVIEGQVESG